jgi:hypothetical protein
MIRLVGAPTTVDYPDPNYSFIELFRSSVLGPDPLKVRKVFSTALRTSYPPSQSEMLAGWATTMTESMGR